MIRVYDTNALYREDMRLRIQLFSEEQSPNVQTLNGVLKLCGRGGSKRRGIA